MEKPLDKDYHHGSIDSINTHYRDTKDYINHLESLWNQSTIHASAELQERFKDGEELPEGSYEVGVLTTPTIGCNNEIPINVAFPAVEEGSQDEVWRDLLLMISHDFAKEHGMTNREALDFAHSCGKAGKDNLIKYQSQYKLTKI